MASLIKQCEHLKIQIEAIRSATNDFNDASCIGKGGFGKVYKGELIHHNNQSLVALKRLNRAFGQGNPEFWKEIMMLSFHKHENIISLLGYCDDSGEKIIVYEYASKGSLDLYLDCHELKWIQRLKICIGAARGLEYLHRPTKNQLRVLHRDIKSSNILLDDNWNAKISDFGLSNFGPVNQQFTFLISNAVGTLGYCDPLYVETGLLTKESDVYSFGVVLFEVLCGRLCMDFGENRDQPLTRLARLYYENNILDAIIHCSIKVEIKPQSLKTFAKVAYRCLKMEREQRPSMADIVKELELALHHQEESWIVGDGGGNTGSQGEDSLRMVGSVIRNIAGCRPQQEVSKPGIKEIQSIDGGVVRLFDSKGGGERRLMPHQGFAADELGNQGLKCPRCDSVNTKFCYFNNYKLSQPRHFCKACRHYWTRGGVIRNVPVGGGCRKNKRSKKKPYTICIN